MCESMTVLLSWYNEFLLFYINLSVHIILDSSYFESKWLYFVRTSLLVIFSCRIIKLEYSFSDNSWMIYIPFMTFWFIFLGQYASHLTCKYSNYELKKYLRDILLNKWHLGLWKEFIHLQSNPNSEPEATVNDIKG